MPHSSGLDSESAPSSRTSSEIPFAVHARLTGTIAVAATAPALLVFLVVHPTEVVESTLMWFFLFPFTLAIAAGLFTPEVRDSLPDSYPATEDGQRLRSVGFTVVLMTAAYAIAVFAFLVAVLISVAFSGTGSDSPFIPALFVVFSALALTPLPSLHVHRKYRNQLAEFTYEAKDRTIAAFVAVFLGGFGGHKFYAGQRRKGVVYLLFCWTFVPWLLGWYAALKYLTADPVEFRRKIAAAYGEPTPDETRGPTSVGTDDSVSDETGQWGPRETSEPSEQATSEVEARRTGSSRESSGAPSPPIAPSSDENKVDELERLYALYEEGAITEDEYEQSKTELLDGL